MKRDEGPVEQRGTPSHLYLWSEGFSTLVGNGAVLAAESRGQITGALRRGWLYIVSVETESSRDFFAFLAGG